MRSVYISVFTKTPLPTLSLLHLGPTCQLHLPPHLLSSRGGKLAARPLASRPRLRPRGLRLARAPAPAATATAAAAAASVAPDDISQLNHRLRVIARRREAASSSSPGVDPAQPEAYLRMIRDQQRLGLRQLCREEGEGEGEGDEDGVERERKEVAAGSSLGHRVDPRELEPGEYVVHKKVGVSKFACISAEDGVDYVFIQYGASLPLREERR